MVCTDLVDFTSLDMNSVRLRLARMVAVLNAISTPSGALLTSCAVAEDLIDTQLPFSSKVSVNGPLASRNSTSAVRPGVASTGFFGVLLQAARPRKMAEIIRNDFFITAPSWSVVRIVERPHLVVGRVPALSCGQPDQKSGGPTDRCAPAFPPWHP